MARKNNEEANEQTVENTVNEVNMNEEKKTIETWKKELSVKDWVFIGLCELKGWVSGKSVTKNEFEKALNDFSKAKVGG